MPALPSPLSQRIDAALSRVQGIAPAEAHLLAEDTALFVDLRPGSHRATHGVIVRAQHAEPGSLAAAFDPAEPDHRAELVAAPQVVLFCQDGRASALAAAQLMDLGLPGVRHLSGGFQAWAAAQLPIETFVLPGQTRVRGLGGVFFKGKQHKELGQWYAKHLGLPIDPTWNGCALKWRPDDAPDQSASTTFSIFKDDSDYFGGSGQRFMLNFRVADLGALLAALRSEGVTVLDEQEEEGFGKFGWVLDGEGHKIELWEPAAGM